MRIMNRDEVDRKYGRLTVMSLMSIDRDRHRHWLCKCDCGASVTVSQNALRCGATRSCGCFNREIITKHGESHPRTKEFMAWQRMIGRCNNLNNKYYNDYGGRGITVCQRWIESYLAFLSDVGRAPSPDHTLGRKDNNGNYEPGNVRWETMKQQNINKRSNRLIDIGGKVQTMREWADETGMKYSTLKTRIRRGGSPHEAIYGPVKERGNPLSP